jgi:hypothetical protein
MKKLILAIIAVSLISCFGNNSGNKNNSSSSLNGKELTVEPGEKWLGKRKIFLFSMDRTPQMAAWIEDEQGNYISTIIVTNKIAKEKWINAPKEGRPEALPVWNHRIQTGTGQIDAVSSATPKGSVDIQINNGSLANGQEYNVYLEINHSFDYNNFWTENNSGVNGQPSLIFHAKITAGIPGMIRLIPIGHGSVDGLNGNIVKQLDSFTSAFTIIKDAYIIIK